MSLLDPLRNYCERTGDTLLSEPVNALSNIVFFIAAWALYKMYRASAHKDWQIALLIGLVAAVGAGSSLFHTLANGLTLLCDIVPITLFTVFYLWLALRHLVRLHPVNATAWLLVFTVIAGSTSHVPDPYRFNGSADYFPCLAALAIIGAYLRMRKHPAAPMLFKAALWFALSLTFRSIDFAICPAVPIGTHFLWHGLNGLVLYLLVRTILKAMPQQVN
jgi:hypothetical protein